MKYALTFLVLVTVFVLIKKPWRKGKLGKNKEPVFDWGKWFKDRFSFVDDLFKWSGIVVAGLLAFHFFFWLLFPDNWVAWWKDGRWFLASNVGILVVSAFLGIKNQEGKRPAPALLAAGILSLLLVGYAYGKQQEKEGIRVAIQKEKRAEIVASAEINFGTFSTNIPAKNDGVTAEWKRIIIPRGTYWSIATQEGMRIRSLGGKPVNLPPRPSLFNGLETACIFTPADGEDSVDLSVVLGSTRNGDVLFEVQSVTRNQQELRGCVKSR